MSYNSYRPQGFSLLPEVVKNLLIINGIFFLIRIVVLNRFQYDLNDNLGLYFPKSEQFKPYQIVSYMFMHGSFMHILLNMFALWMFGSNIENYWGGKRFLIYYMVTGLGAALTHYVVLYYTDIVPALEKLQAFYDAGQITDIEGAKMSYIYNKIPPVVGASGAVFGLLLAFGMMFPEQRIYLYFAIPIKAKYFVILYGLFELFSGINNSQADNVAHFAHLGGMLFGFILIKYWNKNYTRY
ncbi:MAG: rhomboid family intramembrane serine protease [Bacteroidia bacterium]|nr:rhomboid family intramembrane serine protease [Bacteroidia bacterium]MCZ2249685.1 rhomboid family intramembrane serine protease [Bacteroidia bacterium]